MPTRRRLLWFWTWLAWGMATAMGTAGAGSLGVAPTRLELVPGQAPVAVTLRNNAAAPVMVQVQTFAWTGSLAVQDLEPTRELIAVPAVFRLEGNGRQIIRVAQRGGDPAPAERAYRLVISEVPTEPGPGGGVTFALRLSLPVFVTPPGAAPAVSWHVRPTGPAPLLELVNDGTAHLRVSRVVLRAAGRPEAVQIIEGLAYILPGQRRAWPLDPVAARQGSLALSAETQHGDIAATLVLPRS